MKLLKYPSIEQYRSIIKHVRDHANYHNTPYPVIKFNGYVKLHGTNAGIVQDVNNVRWAQSHQRVLSLESDNMGFAQYVHAHTSIFDMMFSIIKFMKHDLDVLKKPNAAIAIYGEWCGEGIQKGVSISVVDKMFVVFDVRISSELTDGTTEDYWFTKDELDNLFIGMNDDVPFRVPNKDKVFYVGQFPNYTIEIDFNKPELSQNELVDLTIKVEDDCPVGKYFGVSGIGEGIVWSADLLSKPGTKIRFKVKGEKHSVSKVKTLAEVDPVKVATIQEFVDRVVTTNRLGQMKQRLFEMELDGNDIKNVGQFLKFLSLDIIKEESDTLEASGISNKEIMSSVNRAGRNWFLENLGDE
jgi:hypothetical protein